MKFNFYLDAWKWAERDKLRDEHYDIIRTSWNIWEVQWK